MPPALHRTRPRRCEPDGAGRPRRLRVVGGDQDRGTCRVQLGEQAEDARPVAVSRRPVGSSARMIAGPPTRGRAIAVRWHSPPDSSPGRCHIRCARPTVASAPAAASLLRGRVPPPQQAAGHVVQRGQRGHQEELLEHEADADCTTRELAVGQAADCGAANAHLTGAGASAPPGRATWTCPIRTARPRRRSRRRDRQRHRPQCGDRRRARALLARRGQFQRGHRATTTAVRRRLRPGDLQKRPGEDPGAHADRPARAARCTTSRP